MKIFCTFPTVNLSKHIFWLVICIAKGFIWTTLKVIYSIFRFFFAPSDSRFSSTCISAKYCPIITNHSLVYSEDVYISQSKRNGPLWQVLWSRLTLCRRRSGPLWSSWSRHSWGSRGTVREESSCSASSPHPQETRSLSWWTPLRTQTRNDTEDCLWSTNTKKCSWNKSLLHLRVCAWSHPSIQNIKYQIQLLL